MKKVFSLIILFFLSTTLFADDDLSLLNVANSDWSTVLPGKVMSTPQITSTGFAVITDARNIMNFTNEGKLICEKPLFKITKPVFSVLPGDLFAVITNYGRALTLLNPDGKELWKADLDYKTSFCPYAGRDGRIFVRHSEGISCFGINGIKKWDLETPVQSEIDLQELPDGSLIVFLSEIFEGKTKALRFSPFGEILEDITFAGQVITSLTTPKGVLLTFSDGTCGLFSIVNNKSTHKWLLKKDEVTKTNMDFFLLSQDKQKIVYVNKHNNYAEINYINQENGEINKSFIISELGNVLYGAYNESGILLADEKTAYFYNNLGRFLWSGVMPDKKAKNYYNYLTFTNDNYFVLFGNNWTMNGFRTAAAPLPPKEETKVKVKKYETFYKIDKSLYEGDYIKELAPEMKKDARYKALSEGNYGKDEIYYATDVLNACIGYQNTLTSSNFGTRLEKNVFEIDSPGIEKMIRQFALFGTDTFIDYEILFLKNTRSKAFVRILLNEIKKNGYDPEGKLLTVLEYLSINTNVKDEQVLCDICDAVYSVCNFMGASYFEKKGKDILNNFLFQRYNSKTRLYASQTLKRLIN